MKRKGLSAAHISSSGEPEGILSEGYWILNSFWVITPLNGRLLQTRRVELCKKQGREVKRDFSAGAGGRISHMVSRSALVTL